MRSNGNFSLAANTYMFRAGTPRNVKANVPACSGMFRHVPMLNGLRQSLTRTGWAIRHGEAAHDGGPATALGAALDAIAGGATGAAA